MFLLGSALVSSLATAIPYPTQQSEADQKSEEFTIHVDLPLRTIGPWMIWNGARNEFVTSGDVERQEYSPLPIINIYNPASGDRRSINILEQFPNVRSVTINGLATASNGSVLVACELEIPGPVRSYAQERILLYDEHSALLKNFRAEPDDVGAVAMDEQGNMYVLGTRDDERSNEESYPLLVKYDEFGHMTREMLPRSLFAAADDPVGDEGEFPYYGGTRIVVGGTSLEVYLAPVKELITVDSAGTIQKRTDVLSLVSEFARTKGYKTSYMDGDELSPSGDLWIIGHFEDPLENVSGTLPVRNFVLRITPEGRLEVPYEHVGEEPPGHYLEQLVGFTPSGEPVAFVLTRDPTTIHLRKNPY